MLGNASNRREGGVVMSAMRVQGECVSRITGCIRATCWRSFRQNGERPFKRGPAWFSHRKQIEKRTTGTECGKRSRVRSTFTLSLPRNGALTSLT